MLKQIYYFFFVIVFFMGGCDMSSKLSSNSTSTFRFEDFKTAQEAEAKLNELFPKGSKLDEITSLLIKLGSKCYVSSKNPGHETVCRYEKRPNTLSSEIVMKVWIVVIHHENNTISSIEVNTGLIGP